MCICHSFALGDGFRAVEKSVDRKVAKEGFSTASVLGGQVGGFPQIMM